jgi:aryl-alcohol dehydrogenase-like predicted oxidoreductase
MNYRLLGRTGVRVSAICLGTVYFGSDIPEAEAIRVVHAALDGGINFIDTAEIYMRPNYGAAEATLGRALQGRRHRVVVATKKRYDPAPLRTGGPDDHGLARHHIIAGVEGSLRRLGTDYIDLYYPHHVDPDVAPEEWLSAFDDLVRAGKVRAIGLSNFPAWQTIETLWIADRRNLTPPACVQTLYNLLDRNAERELIPACQAYGLSLLPYSPLAGGVLTAKYSPAGAPPADSRAARGGHRETGRPGHIPVLNERNLTVARELAQLAADCQATPAQLGIAWLLGRPQVASVIFGASSVAQLDENVRVADLQLDAATLDRLATLGPPPS